jgi:hypothetical protein
LSAAGRPRRVRPGVFSARFAFKSVTEVKTTISKMNIRERGALQRYLSDMDLRVDAPPVLAILFTQSKRGELKIHDLCVRLAANPHCDSKRSGIDEDGRQLTFVLIDDVGFRYWVDDAGYRVIIVKIVLPRSL